MKVLVCVRRLDKGGAEMLECRLAEYLNKAGLETHLLAQYNENIFDGKQASQAWKKKGIPAVHFLDSKNNIKMLPRLSSLYTLLRNQKYDVVITSNSGLDTIIGVMKFFLSFKHVIAFHTYINSAILRNVRIKLWQFFVRRADAYYSIADYVRDNTSLVLNIPSDKNSTIYNSLDKNFLSESNVIMDIRKELNLSDDAKIILAAGRIEARKGFDLVLRYLSQLLNQKEVYLVIVGERYEGTALEEGLNGFDEQFLSEIRTLNLQDKVLFTGYRTDLQLIMRSADLYIHLARHEGFGLVLLEAMAAKLPIVASHVGGMPEVLKNTPYKTFDLNDQEGIYREALHLLFLNTEEKKIMTEQAYQALPFFSDERRSKEVELLLKKITS